MFCQFLSVQQNESAVHINVAVVQSLIHVQLFCNPMDCSLPSSSVHGISQARILKLVAISISNTYTYNFFGFGFPSHLGYHRALSRVPCAIQVGSHQLSILYIVEYICQSQSPNSSHPQPFSPWCISHYFPASSVCHHVPKTPRMFIYFQEDC